MPGKTKQPPITNVKNPELEAVIAEFAGKKPDQALQTRLLVEFLKAQFIVPVEFPKDTDPRLLMKMRQGRPLDKGEQIRTLPVILKNDKTGKTAAPAFTSSAEIKDGSHFKILLQVPAAQVVQVLLSNPSIANIFVNPQTKGLLLNRAFAEACDKVLKSGADPAHIKQVQMTVPEYIAFNRRQVERILLPKRLYGEKAAFMTELDEKREAVVIEAYKKLYNDKVPFPYKDEDFRVMPLSISETVTAVVIEYPKEKLVYGQALSAYLIYDAERELPGFYLIEKGEPGENNVLCSIDRMGKFEEQMTAPSEGNELSGVLDLFGEEQENYDLAHASDALKTEWQDAENGESRLS